MEGVRLIYSFATKIKQFSAVKKLKHKRFLSSFFGSSETNISQPTPPLQSPQQLRDEAEDMSSVMLTIFAANVDVSLDSKLAAEVQRSTKKNAPRTLKYELIYVCVLLRRLLEVLIPLLDGEGGVRCEQKGRRRSIRNHR